MYDENLSEISCVCHYVFVCPRESFCALSCLYAADAPHYYEVLNSHLDLIAVRHLVCRSHAHSMCVCLSVYRGRTDPSIAWYNAMRFACLSKWTVFVTSLNVNISTYQLSLLIITIIAHLFFSLLFTSLLFTSSHLLFSSYTLFSSHLISSNPLFFSFHLIIVLDQSLVWRVCGCTYPVLRFSGTST